MSRADLIFVVDAASPNAISNWENIKETIATIISAHYYGHRAIRVGIVLYGSDVQVCIIHIWVYRIYLFHYINHVPTIRSIYLL